MKILRVTLYEEVHESESRSYAFINPLSVTCAVDDEDTINVTNVYLVGWKKPIKVERCLEAFVGDWEGALRSTN